jgi:glycosidase
MFYTFIRYFRSIKIQRLLVSFVVVFGFTVGFSQAQSHHDWSYNLTMYEVNVRQYSESGTFAAVEADLDRLEDLGVGILWFMPIHPIGEVNRLGSLGSYYSVKDYLGINPEFGTKEEFKSLVDAAHDRGMYVLMDWVPNHTSWDNVLTETNPDWYVRESGRFISPPGTNWSDVIQLDHSQPGLRDYMVDAMRYWVDSLGVDGYRFDAASFVPDAFWTEVLPRVRESRSDLFFLAEDDNPKYHRLGFDSSFGWGFYGFGGGVLSQIAAGQAGPSQLGTYLVNESRTYR